MKFKRGELVYFGNLLGTVIDNLGEGYSYPVVVQFSNGDIDYFISDGRFFDNTKEGIKHLNDYFKERKEALECETVQPVKGPKAS